MSIILDPSRDGLEILYDNKLTNIVGLPEKCIDWLIRVSCGVLEITSSKEIYEGSNFFEYKGRTWEQLSKLYLDINGIGRVYANILDEIGIEFEKLDVKRVNLYDETVVLL